MKQSPRRHVLAILRLALGLGQKEMAEVVGTSRATIQAVELGNLKMSELLAMKVSKTTGANLEWLMKNDVEAPPVSTTGKPYVRWNFERAQALQDATLDPGLIEVTPDYLFSYYVRLRAIFASAGKRGEQQWLMAFYKLDRAINELRKEFGVERSIDPGAKNGASVAVSELDFALHDLRTARERFERQGIEVQPEPDAASIVAFRDFREKHEQLDRTSTVTEIVLPPQPAGPRMSKNKARKQAFQAMDAAGQAEAKKHPQKKEATFRHQDRTDGGNK